ncbi:MAG: hypothetical protein EBR30_15390 [Cytophagia bacterium]|nr:hypothetical protein [Cytophagia bacterium]
MNLKYPWQPIKEYKEILFHKYEGIARISINRPQVHNAFTPLTVQEMIDAMNICREDMDVRVIILTGEGGKAFCSGGDQSVRGHGGYVGQTYVAWAKKMIAKSPIALRMLKSSFNAELDGQAGIQELAGNATLLYYLSEEAKEGKNAFLEKRDPDWSKYPKFP